jgi:TolB-like protein/DNA-binding winged helix-turn-helix (wHTH) protein
MPDEPQVLRIGEWRVDPELDELSRGGQTTRLEPRTMRLLLHLAEHAGRVVDVQHLLDEVWPNVVVTQGSVYQAVAELRRILGDDSEHPTYIENLPRRGYRLIAPVAPWNAAAGSSQKVNPPIPAEQPSASPTPDRAGKTGSEAVAAPLPLGQPRRNAVVAGITVAAVIVAGIAFGAFWRVRHAQLTGPLVGGKTEVLVTPAPATFAPPRHSIAVLPFVNIGGDKEQEYFSDGLTEELLDSLSRINELRVAARTSSFYFKGKDVDLPTIAHKLNVASVLEGSVRRSGNRIRITAQLNNAVTGFHLWSQTYDRDIGDVLQLQTEIATAVAEALKVTLLGDVGAKIELGGTRNAAAFDAYLRGRKAYERSASKDFQDAIVAYSESIRFDPNYALAFAGQSIAYSSYAAEFATGPAIREFYDKALANAHQALALAPELAEGHLALAQFFDDTLDFAQASESYGRARTLAPGNAEVLSLSGAFAVWMGHMDAGLTALRRAVELDPLNPRSHYLFSRGLLYSRRYEEAVAAATDAISVDPDFQSAYGWRGFAYYELGDLERARASCEEKPDHWVSQFCLAITYERLGRHAEAEVVLAKMRAMWSSAEAYQYAAIYAQWGNTPKALEWLDAAIRVRDPGLELMETDPLMDPLRKEPRFQAIERELKFPD